MIDNALKYMKEEAVDLLDSAILDSIDKSSYDDYEEYKEDMESFTFDDIF